MRCSFSLRLVEDLPGEHVYIHHCKTCGRECGPEFIEYHRITGKTSDPVPEVTPPICSGRQWQRGDHPARRLDAVTILFENRALAPA